MLEFLRSVGCKRLIGTVQGIENGKGYTIKTASNHGLQTVHADGVVNAAGPFAGEIAQMLGVDLLVTNTFQQKIAFEDHLGLVPRTMPFSIDLDAQAVDWTEDERAMLFGRIRNTLGWLNRCLDLSTAVPTVATLENGSNWAGPIMTLRPSRPGSNRSIGISQTSSYVGPPA